MDRRIHIVVGVACAFWAGLGASALASGPPPPGCAGHPPAISFSKTPRSPGQREVISATVTNTCSTAALNVSIDVSVESNHGTDPSSTSALLGPGGSTTLTHEVPPGYRGTATVTATDSGGTTTNSIEFP